MRALMYLLAALTVMVLAFWAYRENYRTQAQIDEMQAVQNEIARLRDDLGVLRAEWAYLNRPERLRELVDMNFDRLRLGAVQATQFGAARNIDYPRPPEPAPAGTETGGPEPDAAPPAPSNNRGAPVPRPVRAAAPAPEAAPEAAAAAPGPDAAPPGGAGAPDDADLPADSVITETAPED
ncbi:cell division protein FtsL [Paracoccus contaminans]|uniref:cell division protein FtsL n=1 Tax=Paracoccus contaminans TaxID=1945662 RepID=UPI00269A454D